MEEKDSDSNRHPRLSGEARSNAEAACQPVQKLIEDLRSAIEIEKLKRGARQGADELNLAFVIAKEFEKHIGAPRPCSGPFPDIIDYCFEIMGIKGKDRTRAIRQALKKLSCS
jgi:hypothetical protein